MNPHFKQVIQRYVRAKDDNKPFLMQEVFTPTSTLEMQLNTDGISFPSKTSGLANITSVLSSNFNQTYENIYTFCLADSIEEKANELSCDWLVGMSKKGTGKPRLGYGTYLWQFEEKQGLVSQLTITIEAMATLDVSNVESIVQWLDPLPYPWCNKKQLLDTMPTTSVSEPISAYFA